MCSVPCDRYLQEACELADRLLSLADEADASEHDDGCGILLGVLRDCAYKIRREAERERRSHRLRQQQTS